MLTRTVLVYLVVLGTAGEALARPVWGGVSLSGGLSADLTPTGDGDVSPFVSPFASVETGLEWKHVAMYVDGTASFLEFCNGTPSASEGSGFGKCHARIVSVDTGVDVVIGAFRAGPWVGVGFQQLITAGGRLTLTTQPAPSHRWAWGILLRGSVVDLSFSHGPGVPYTPAIDVAFRGTWRPATE